MLPSICWDFNTNYGQCIILTQSPLGRKANLSRWKWYPRYRFFHARRCLISVSGRELSTIKRLAFLKNEQRERSLSLSMIALSLSQLFTESSLLFSFFCHCPPDIHSNDCYFSSRGNNFFSPHSYKFIQIF